MASLSHVIHRFVSTNKSVAAELRGVYTCVVDPTATKIDIKNAFRDFYGVTVLKVNVTQMREKFHNTRNGIQMKRSPYTKAMVTLAKGQKLNDFGVTQ